MERQLERFRGGRTVARGFAIENAIGGENARDRAAIVKHEVGIAPGTVEGDSQAIASIRPQEV